MPGHLVSGTVSSGTDATATQYNNLRKDVITNAGDIADSTGSANAYLLAIDAAYTVYANGDKFRFKANFAITGAATLNVNTIGAKALRNPDNTPLQTGDIVNKQEVEVTYDSTDDVFKLVSPSAAPVKMKVGTLVVPGATGSQAITGVGFKPKLMMFKSSIAASSGGDQSLHTMDGAARSSSERWVNEAYVSDSAAASAQSQDTAHCITLRAGASSGSVTDRADFTSMDTDGFTLNWDTVTTVGRVIMYIAIG